MRNSFVIFTFLRYPPKSDYKCKAQCPPVTLASKSKEAGATPSLSLEVISTAVRGGGVSTVINILSDTVRPVESVTVISTLYVPAHH